MRRPGLLACALVCASTAAGSATLELQTKKLRVELVTVAEGLDHPWSIAFLPGGRMLVTERSGALRFVSQKGEISAPLKGVPQVLAQGQGGLLDVALDPGFARNRFVYLSYAEARSATANGTTVARAKLMNDELVDPQVIFRQQPAVGSPAHFGSRLAFARDGHLFVTLGERAGRQFIDRAQYLDTHFGKIVRIASDGRVPRDNPFVDRAGAMPEIWSYGHRNVQGAAIHPETGELWITEHGPYGGDELNVARAGRNYGWPVVTYGVAYSGEKIGIGTEMAGVESPVTYWVPSIGISGLSFYSGRRISEWRGNAFVGGLASKSVSRLELESTHVTSEERILSELQCRIRDIREGTDGWLYVLTDAPRHPQLPASRQGRILRIQRAEAAL